MSIHTNVNGAVTELTKFPVSVNGAKTELSEMYQGTDGVKRLIFQAKTAPLMICGYWMLMPNMATATDKTLYTYDSYGITTFKYNNGYLDSDNVYKLYGGTISGSGETWQAVSVDHIYLLSDYFSFQYTFSENKFLRFQDYTYYLGDSKTVTTDNTPTKQIVVKTSGHGSTFQIISYCEITIPTELSQLVGHSGHGTLFPTAYGNISSITLAFQHAEEWQTTDPYTGDPVYQYDFYECDFTIDTNTMSFTSSGMYYTGTDNSSLGFQTNLGNLLTLLSATTYGGIIGEYLNGYLSFGKVTSVNNTYGYKIYTWFVCKINSTSSITPYGTGITTQGEVPPLIIGKGV